jgi:hypothetical protein
MVLVDPGDQDVVTGASVKQVVPRRRRQPVSATTAVELVVAESAAQVIIAAEAVDGIVAVGASKRGAVIGGVGTYDVPSLKWLLLPPTEAPPDSSTPSR